MSSARVFSPKKVGHSSEAIPKPSEIINMSRETRCLITHQKSIRENEHETHLEKCPAVEQCW